MAHNQLIIMAKNPVLGKVKTRLAHNVGPQKALEIYNQLLAYTQQVCIELKEVNCSVFYSDFVDLNDQWNNDNFEKQLQIEGNLGQKMETAADWAFNKGAKNVVIIGTDCPKITKKHIEEAFAQLKHNAFVIGPAFDGGYYLIGMRVFRYEIFKNIIWSGNLVLSDTLKAINKMVKTVYLLEPLPDIDTQADLVWL